MTMSDAGSTLQAPSHPTLGGKSLQSLERPRYKSWRKKYRKMRAKFDGVLEENKRLFKEEYKLEAIAKRLREDLDGLLELSLDLNQSASIPPDLRFNIDYPGKKAAPNVVAPDIPPEQANSLLAEYRHAVQEGRIPPLDLHVIREQIDARLAAQDVRPLATLESTVPHTSAPTTNGDGGVDLPEEMKGEELPGFLTSEQEDEYLLRLDAKTDERFISPAERERLLRALPEAKHPAELTPRELERQVELLNPQSQHKWLKKHTKLHPDAAGGIADDIESLASHDINHKAPARKRGGGGGGGGAGKNLAKQVGDRAVERAREGFSPSAASGFEEDELGFIDEHPSRKRARDPDGTYRVKGGGAKGSGKGKRKRTSEETVASPGSGAKKVRTESSGVGGLGSVEA